MPTILRLLNTQKLNGPCPHDFTTYILDATHQYFFFAEYHVLENGAWTEGRGWAGVTSTEDLFDLLNDAGVLRDITPPKQ